MTAGLPDYYNGINLALQSLAQIVQRPYYGTISGFSASGTVTASSATPVWMVSGAGAHFGIYFWAQGAATQKNDYVRVIADGNTVNFPTFKQFNDYNFSIPIGAEASGTCYDETNFIYAGVGGAFKTWSSYHSGWYVETHGRTPTAGVIFVYALF